MLEWKEFRTLLLYVNAQAEALLPASGNTAKDWVRKHCKYEKEKIKARLASSLSNIHFTVDAWTSPNCMAILAVVAHYTDADGNLTYSPLCIKEMSGEHSGANMAIIVNKKLKDYNIPADKIGYFMMHNAGNNDHLIKHLAETFEAENNITYDPTTHRLQWTRSQSSRTSYSQHQKNSENKKRQTRQRSKKRRQNSARKERVRRRICKQ